MEKKCVKELNTDYGKSYNGYKFILPVAGELVFLFFMFFMARLMDPSLERTWFHDAVSEGLIYGSVLAILLITGLLPDFFRSFIYAFKQPEEITVQMLKRSLFSMKLAMITAMVSEAFGIVISFVSMIYGNILLGYSSLSAETLPICLMGLGGAAIHGILVVIVLLPVYARLKVRLISR